MEQHITLLVTRHPWLGTLVERAFKVVVIIAIVLVCAKLIRILSARVLELARRTKFGAARDGTEHEKRMATVVKLLETTLRVILIAVALLMLLRELGLDITPFLTGAGIAGVAVGFGAQSLVRDVISGFFLLIEDQIRVGDVVKVNNLLSGAVERMELRVTAIRDAEGTLHIIPNGEIKSVSNMTYDFAQAVVDIPVPYQTDTRVLSQVLTSVAHEIENDPQWKMELRSRPEFLGIVKFETDHMVVELDVKTGPHARWAVARELRARAKLALDHAGIALPVPLLRAQKP